MLEELENVFKSQRFCAPHIEVQSRRKDWESFGGRTQEEVEDAKGNVLWEYLKQHLNRQSKHIFNVNNA